MNADVIIQYPIKKLDKVFSYIVPNKFQNKIKVGMKVIVPFNNGVINGIVLNINNDKKDFEMKEILNIDDSFIINSEQLKLAYYLKKTTLCPLISAIEVMLPPALKISNNIKDYKKYDIYITLNVSFNEASKYICENQRNRKQIEIIDKVINEKKVLRKNISSSSLKVLLDKSILKEVKEKVNRINTSENGVNNITLNEKQKNAYETISKQLNIYNVFLLQGVTGSGKTEVYMALIDKTLENKKSVIVLVPEICLTTQTVQRFYKRFGNKVAIFHSGLSVGEKYDEYMKIYHNKVSIVVGTRSSIFVPIKNLGLIIIDEEHSDSYKQESSPRYDAIEVAKYRASINNIPLILASATPSLESKARAYKNVYKLVELKNRANGKLLPKTILVDMKKSKDNIFSEELIDKINDRLNKNEQIILLLNRRGFSTFITCSNCGFTYKCPNCDITLTYHKTTNNLRCHYCSYVIKKEDCCPKCHEKALNYLGLGTQKVEEKIKELFNNAKVIRMDQDTTTKKGSYQKIIDDFSNKKYDILLGTQMISKGLDFSNVTLVGIINADTSLNIPDFRSNEKTFALLYQTSGRAGRGENAGEVIIQTYNPDNKVLNFVKDNDYENFFKYELNIRHLLFYPPYSYIVLIKIIGKDYDLLGKESNKIKKFLKDNLNSNTIIYGPTPASVFKINNVYHYQIIIKYTKDDTLYKILSTVDNNYILNSKINVEITFNPIRL